VLWPELNATPEHFTLSGGTAMKALQATPELLRVARRVIWFEEPEEALSDPIQFLAHVMVFGGIEDLKALRGIVGKGEYREVLQHAPPGVFDARSWAYWNLVLRPATHTALAESLFASTATKAKVVCRVAARALILASGDDRW
jgi:hypothetical protein